MNAIDLNPAVLRTAAGVLVGNSDSPLYVPDKPLTEAALCDWIAASTAGARIQYHQGLLLLDRSGTDSRYPAKERQRIHALAKRAWRACELGLVHLVSQRVEPFIFNYIAVRSLTISKPTLIREQLRASMH